MIRRLFPLALSLAVACAHDLPADGGRGHDQPKDGDGSQDDPTTAPTPTALVGMETTVDWTVHSNELLQSGALPETTDPYGYRATALASGAPGTFLYTTPDDMERTLTKLEPDGQPVAADFGWPIEDFRGSEDVQGLVALSPDGTVLVTADGGGYGIRVDAYDATDGTASSILWSQRFYPITIGVAVRALWFDADGTLTLAASGFEEGHEVCRVLTLGADDGTPTRDVVRPDCSALSAAHLRDGTLAWGDIVGNVTITDLDLEPIGEPILVEEYFGSCGAMGPNVVAGPDGPIVVQTRWKCNDVGASEGVESQLTPIRGGVAEAPVPLGDSLGTLVTLGPALAWIACEGYLVTLGESARIRWLDPETFAPLGDEVQLTRTLYYMGVRVAPDGDNGASVLVSEDRNTPFTLAHITFEGTYE